MIPLGIDVSKNFLEVFDGTSFHRFRNEPHLPQLLAFLRSRSPDLSRFLLIFEATGVYSAYLWAFCAQHRIPACRLNPRRLHHLAELHGSRGKTDRVDARLLYRCWVHLRQEEIQVPEVSPVLERLWGYLRAYQMLVRQRSQWKNYREAMERNPWMTGEMRGWVEERIRELDREIQGLRRRMREEIEVEEGLRERYRRILGVKGIGEITGVGLLVLFERHRGLNRRRVGALLGLDPVVRESGERVRRRGGISKAGDRGLRGLLYCAAMVAVRWNGEIRKVYERLVGRGKARKVALVACARRLAVLAYYAYAGKLQCPSP